MRHSRLHAWLIALCVTGYPLVSAFPLMLGVSSRFVSWPYRCAVILASTIALVGSLSRGARLVRHPVTIVMVLFWLMLCARIAWDSLVVGLPDPTSQPWLLFAVQTLALGILPAVPFLLQVDEASVDRARVLVVTLGTAALLMVARAGLGSAVSAEMATEHGRISTETLNPITLGHLALSVLIVSAFSFEKAGRLRDPGKVLMARAGLAGAGLLGLGMLVAAASRGPLLVLVMLAAVGAFAQALRFVAGSARMIGRMLVLAAGFVLVVAVTLFINATTPLRPLDRFSHMDRDASAMGRVGLMTRAYEQFLENPFLGDATYERESRFYPHNIIVESGMAGGAVGLGLLAAMIIPGCLASWFAIRRATSWQWLAYLQLQYLASFLLSGSIFLAVQFFVFTLLVCGLAVNERRRLRSRRRAAPALVPTAS